MLLSLPTEILEIVANELSAEDYGALRLSCKLLEMRLFPHFAPKFFTSKHFFRNYYSLSVLGDISESRLASFVKTVVLGTELIPGNIYGISSGDSVNDCLKVYADQRSLCASGWDRDLLYSSFSKLPNLEGLVVKEFEGDCDEDRFHPSTPQSRARIQAGYGLKSIMQEFGIEDLTAFKQDEFDEEEVGINCVQAVLASAARAKKPLKSFKIAYHELGCSAVSCDALHIPFFQKDIIPPILATIEELHLDVFQKRLIPWPPSTAPGQIYDYIECDTFPLRKFLGYTGELRCLTLRQLDHMEPKDGFWDWMAADPTAKYQGPGDSARLVTPPPVAFNHLRELHLGHMRVPIKPLTNLLRKIAPTMRNLNFCRMLVYNVSADPSHDGLPRNLWKEVFRVLVDVSSSHLYEIKVAKSFSKRSRESHTPVDPDDDEIQAGQLIVLQRDIHHKQSREANIKLELNKDIQTPDEMQYDPRPPSPSPIDNSVDDGYTWYDGDGNPWSEDIYYEGMGDYDDEAHEDFDDPYGYGYIWYAYWRSCSIQFKLTRTHLDASKIWLISSIRQSVVFSRLPRPWLKTHTPAMLDQSLMLF